MKVEKNRIHVVIPAFNEAKRIGDVISQIKALGFNNIVVVNDGSTDRTAEIAEGHDVKVISHYVNRGAGAATQTGLSYVKEQNGDIAVTIDADGQHNPKDIGKLVEHLVENELDVVIGSRMMNSDNVPLLRRFYNFIASLITYLLSSIMLSDTQSGLKAFNSKALRKIYITTGGYEFCTEIIMEINHHKLKYAEIPIEVNYTESSLGKGQNFATGLTTVFRLFLHALSR